MVMHSSDGTFCKTLDKGVELWLLDPHTEPCLSYAPSGSPAGPPVFVAAVKDGKIVGKVIYLPVPILLDRDNALAAICMDLEIMPGFRGLKLFRAMLDEGAKACRDLGVCVILGLPNQNSYLPVVKRGGFKLLGVLPFWVKPVTLDSFFKQYIPIAFLASACRAATSLFFTAYTRIFCGFGSSRLSVVESVSGLDVDRLTLLLERADRELPHRVDKTPDYFCWRYRHPAYFFISADDGTALLVGCCLQKEGRRIGFICDILLDGSKKSLRSGKKLVQEAERVFRAKMADMCVALFQAGTPQSVVLKKAGLFKVPDRFMKRKMRVTFMNLANSESPFQDFSQWSLTVSDFDVTPYYEYQEMVLD
jgi:GNAT superfamily N-acetyltransferase